MELTNNHLRLHSLLRPVPSSPDQHVFGLWKEARVPRDNPSRHRENMHIHTERPLGWGSNPQSCCCELTALTTASKPSLREVYSICGVFIIGFSSLNVCHRQVPLLRFFITHFQHYLPWPDSTTSFWLFSITIDYQLNMGGWSRWPESPLTMSIVAVPYL